MSERLRNAAAIVFMVCSVTGTSAVVWSATHLQRSSAQVSTGGRSVSEWRAIGMSGHVRGPEAARVTLVEFADYQCPACRAFEPTLKELLRRHPTALRVVFRHYPLQSIHPQALVAAKAAECAASQGKFEALHDVLYALQDSLGIVSWDALAARAGVPSLDDFHACVADARVPPPIQRDVEVAQRLEIQGTPTMLINDSLYVGPRGLTALDSMIVVLSRRVAR